MIQVDHTHESLSHRGLRVARSLSAAAARSGQSSWSVALRLLRVWRRTGIRPGEGLELGLGDPSVADDLVSAHVSKARLQALQDALNPAELAPLTEDKSLFYPHCEALRVPVPRTLAVVRPNGGWIAGGAPVLGSEGWERSLAKVLPDTFVSKPALGVYGEAVSVWKRSGDGFADQGGRMVRPGQLCEVLMAHPKYKSFVLQERLEDHPALTALTGSRFLQTIRVATLIDGAGAPELIYAEWKVIAGSHAVDNFRRGSTGNLICNVAAATGRLSAARRPSADGVGMETVAAHPFTGQALEGFELPHWQELLALVKRCALLFRPLRTIGWDVALTLRGPVVVEGNRWWDPGNDAILGPAAPGVERHELVEGIARLRHEARAAGGVRAHGR